MQNNLESIWADGLIPKYQKEDILTPEEVLSMAIKFTLDKVLAGKSLKIIGINDKVGHYPNILLAKADKLYGLVVAPCLFPNYANISDQDRIGYVNLCKAKNTVPLFAPVMLTSADRVRAGAGLFLRGDIFRMISFGLKIMTDSPTQDLSVKALDFKF